MDVDIRSPWANTLVRPYEKNVEPFCAIRIKQIEFSAKRHFEKSKPASRQSL
jgi:hypothetical protein